MRRTRIAAVLTLAVINVLTLVAGVAVARMLPARLAALKVPTIAPAQVTGPGTVLGPVPRTPPRPPPADCRPRWTGRCPPRPSAARSRPWSPTRPPARS